MKTKLLKQLTGATLFIGMLVLPFMAQAGDINGKAVDANTGKFLPGAQVTLPDLNRATRTDRHGDFRFTNVPAGSTAVEVNFIGYDVVSKKVEVPETGTVSPRISVGQEILELEEYVIEGFREGRSLALQQKKTADSIRDILSADSVGQLPDRNVADALVRLPGVALDMSEGEGRFVSIRGMSADLNNVTVNGATVSNPGVDGRSGRAMPLDLIGSAQISQLEVIKAPTPDMDAQGIGGTVEIKTASAFDKEEGYFNGSFESGVVTSADKATYRGEATWAKRLGEKKILGVALSASYEWKPFSTDEVELNWDNDDFLTDYDNDGVFEGEENIDYVSSQELIPSSGNRQRIGLNTKIELKPNEDTEFYFNGIYNKFSQWFEGLESNLEGDRLDYDEDQDSLGISGGPIFDVDGNIVDTENGRLDRLEPYAISPTQIIFPTVDQFQHRGEVENKTQTLINLTFGGKKRWGNLTLSGELNYSFAQEEDEFENQIQFRGRSRRDGMMHLRPESLIADPNNSGDDAPITSLHGVTIPAILDPEGDGLRWDPSNQRLNEIDGPQGGDPIPVLADMGGKFPGLFVPQEVLFDLSRFAHRRNRIDLSILEENTYIPRFDAQWDSDNFFGTGNTGFIKVGAKYFNRNRIIDDNSFRPIFCIEEDFDADDCFDREELFRNGKRIRISGAEVPNLTVPARNVLGFYDEGLEVSATTAFQQSMGGNTPTAGNTLHPFSVNEVESSENDIEDDYDLDEKILSLYAMTSVNFGEKLTVLGGVRFEFTDVVVTANQWTRFDDFGEGDAPDDFVSPCADFDSNRDSTFCVQTSEATFNYDDIFPNIQAIYRFNDNLQLRGAFTVTTGRPNFEDAAPITRFEVTLDDAGGSDEAAEIDEVRARVRNPSLSPYYSYNLDLSLEYYTDWGALFSVAAFHKEIDDPIFAFENRDRDYCGGRDDDNPLICGEFDEAFFPTDPNGDGRHSTVADATLVIQELCDCTVDTTFVDSDDLVKELRLEGVTNAEHGRITGIEFTTQIPLIFLPNPLDGFSLDANATFVKTDFDIFERRGASLETPFFRTALADHEFRSVLPEGPLAGSRRVSLPVRESG